MNKESIQNEIATLEQIRAKAALEFYERSNNKDTKGTEEGDVIKGLPSLIINNGLLATLAFAVSKKAGYLTYMEEVCNFLAEKRGLLEKAYNLEGYIKNLSQADSLILQQCTEEALEYIGYLKRFAK